MAGKTPETTQSTKTNARKLTYPDPSVGRLKGSRVAGDDKVSER